MSSRAKPSLAVLAGSVLTAACTPGHDPVAPEHPPPPRREAASVTTLPPSWRSREQVESEVLVLVRKHTGRAPVDVTPGKRFHEELDMDSLDKVELVSEIEETFQVAVPDVDCDRLGTPGAVADYLWERRTP